MPIKDPILFISVEEFKTWKGFDKKLFDNVTNSDENIFFAIATASSNIDYISGFNIGKKWPETPETSFTYSTKLATTYYTRFLCSKGVDYTRGQASMAQGGIVYSEDNPDDPYFIPPDVFNELRKIKEYITFKGFNINRIVNPKPFNSFMNPNGGIENPFELYVAINNLFAGYGIIITKEIIRNIIGKRITISVDKSIIPSLDNYYNRLEIDGKFNFVDDEIKAIEKEIQDNVSSLVAQINLKQNISDMVNYYNKLETNNLWTNKTDTTYVDSELLKKQDKLTAGTNITIENNVISAISTVTWIKGEFKWMDNSVTEMPAGWKKHILDDIFNKNLTLVHNFVQPTNLNQSFGLTNNTDYANFSQATRDNIFNTSIDAMESGKPVHVDLLCYQGATLWQYDPDNEFS